MMKGMDLHIIQELANYEKTKLEYKRLQEKVLAGEWLQRKEYARLAYLEQLITTIDELYERLPDKHKMILQNAELTASELAALLDVSVRQAASMKNEVLTVFASRMGWDRTKSA